MLQEVPSQSSARVPEPEAPTAMHQTSETHETLSRLVAFEPLGLGTLCTVQLLPSHVSANESYAAPVSSNPTAVQNVSDVQETPPNPRVPGGVGAFRMIQEPPSHSSARVLEKSSPGEEIVPTAMHHVCEVHDTLSKSAPVEGFGV
jgi:hypothetical protein